MERARLPRGASLLRLAESVGLRALRARGFRSRYLPTDAGRVHVLDGAGSGTGPPLLLLHGLGSSGADLAPLLHALRPHTRRVVAPDLPGHGWSELPTEPRAEALHRAVVGVLERLDPGPVLIVGNSLGGLVGVRVALARPERVAGMVLMSPGGAPVDEAELDALIDRFRPRDQAEGLQFVARLQARPSSVPSRWLQAWGLRHRMARPGTRAVLDGATVEQLLTAADSAALPSPTLVLWGRQDRILPADHREFWRTHLPEHGVLEEPEGVGHAPYLDALEPVVARIEAFVRRVDAGR